MIHFSNAVKFYEPLNNSIHVHRHPVARLVTVAAMLVKRYALVHQDILDRHHNVDPNVLSHLNVHQTEPASITNVLIHVRILVASDPFVMSEITIQFALVHLVSQAIHFHNAFVSPNLFPKVFFMSKSTEIDKIKFCT